MDAIGPDVGHGLVALADKAELMLRARLECGSAFNQKPALAQIDDADFKTAQRDDLRTQPDVNTREGPTFGMGHSEGSTALRWCSTDARGVEVRERHEQTLGTLVTPSLGTACPKPSSPPQSTFPSIPNITLQPAPSTTYRHEVRCVCVSSVIATANRRERHVI